MYLEVFGSDTNVIDKYLFDSSLKLISLTHLNPATSLEQYYGYQFQLNGKLVSRTIAITGNGLGTDASGNLDQGTITGIKFRDPENHTEAEISQINWAAADFTKALNDVDSTGKIDPLVTLMSSDPVTLWAVNATGPLNTLDSPIFKAGFQHDTYINGSGFDDVITGGLANENVTANEGNDTVRTGRGNDMLDGGAGNDRLYGQLGSDSLFGGTGDDRLFGGYGADTLLGEYGNDILFGNKGNDRLEGGLGKDTLNGQKGSDTLLGQQGNDKLTGGLGNDQIKGGLNNDKLFGQQGADTLFGGSGRDRLFGGTGDDVLNGGKGIDYLKGGAGRDTFVFRQGDGADRVQDFQHGIDTLSLDDTLWSGQLTAKQVVDTYATINGADIIFTFDGGEEITLLGAAGIANPADDVQII